MKRHDLESMSVDQLWSLHQLVASMLAGKISAEKARLDERLRQLVEPDTALANVKKMPHARRPYPQVLPKYINPLQPSETWAGRGKQPRWLTAQLRSGKQLDDFRIQLDDFRIHPPSDRARRRKSRTNRKASEGGLNRSA